METELEGFQRRYLRGLAHHLDPIVLIGKGGVNKNLIENINQALYDHELIKVKFIEHKEDKKELLEEIEAATESIEIGLVGHTAILFKAHPEKTKQKIIVPRRRSALKIKDDPKKAKRKKKA